MKNLHGLTVKFCIMSVLSATIVVAAGFVSAGQTSATFTSSEPVLLASTSFNGKPPFNRHTDAKQVVNKQATDVSLKSIKWKPPFNRYLHRQDNLHNVQVAQLGEVTRAMIGNTDVIDKKLKGSKPPFKRN